MEQSKKASPRTGNDNSYKWLYYWWVTGPLIRRDRLSLFAERNPGPHMNKKLHVGGLSFSADANRLREFFAADGRQVASVQIMQDKLTGRSRGFGFVEMATFEDAKKAIEALNGKDFLGSRLTVSEAGERGGSTNLVRKRGGDRS